MKDDKNKKFFRITVTNKKGNEDGTYNYLFGLRNEEKDVKDYTFVSKDQYEEGDKFLLPKNYAELSLVQLQTENKPHGNKELSESQKFSLLSFAICAFVFTIVVLYKIFPWRREEKILKKPATK
jgi:hypothetical protein